MAQVPHAYEPLTIGRSPHIGEMEFVDPYVLAVGFEQAMSPQDALETVTGTGGTWEHAEPDHMEFLGTDRSEYRFVRGDGDTAPTPLEVGKIIADSRRIRYIVPIYSVDGAGIPAFALVPNHVVVSYTDMDLERIEGLDSLAADQGFFPLIYRDAVIGPGTRRIYSSLATEALHEPPEEFDDYVGEPGPALWLIAAMASEFSDPGSGLVVEPDWYLAYPNDLGTPATMPRGDRHDNPGWEA